LPNAIVQDRRLSLDTKGLLAYLLSLPPSWEIRPNVIASKLSPEGGRPIGRERLQRMLGELQATGYMARSQEQSHRDGGHWGSFAYIVGADPEAVSKEAEASGVAFRPQSDLPSTGEPSTANPTTDKRKKDNNQSNIKTERPEFPYGTAAIAISERSKEAVGRLREHASEFRPTRRKRTEAVQHELAARLGGGDPAHGWLILSELSASDRDALTTQQRLGTLDDAAIARLLFRVGLSQKHEIKSSFTTPGGGGQKSELWGCGPSGPRA
jgi:hypothetical protein